MTAGTLVDNDAIEIGSLYSKARNSIIDSVKYQLECGARLTAKKESLGHGEWLPWLEDNAETLGFGNPATAQRLMKLSNTAPAQHLEDMNEAEAIAISKKTWGHDAHVGQNSGEHEWYTPPEFIESARSVLGGIDLDPATSTQAQKVVNAEVFYTKDDDGLEQPWAGKVWMNPPYQAALVDQFMLKMKEHCDGGDVSAAITLTNNSTDTSWFNACSESAAALCLVRGRVRFVSPDGEKGAPLQGQAFLYFGRASRRFVKTFSKHGTCWMKP